ncbi:BTB POZ domain [Trypanosoma vivax]|uniref:BTB domain-containing protein n=1 Tax=Trypanosoma vivax (strain Y486) TaxID=1055687 RepID=G0UC47_TRYVY|nr:hypothetical protein TRVL_06405 [Trypanosoma vivax]KAH8609504.1 BTB POZ domain [Trypanosoma vivax]CCC53395.1 conserved hypothetical protein [Trypanosoma vivax Y486]
MSMKECAPAKKRKQRENDHATHGTEAHKDNEAVHDTSSSTRPAACTDRRVRLNVGGELITTLASTLCSEPSRLSEWVANDFLGLPRDAAGNPFIDRDPESFRRIIGYMRGYGLPHATEKIALMAEDALYFRLEKLRALIDPPAEWRFVSGPGISPDCRTFSTKNILCTCGNEPLSTAESSICIFRVDKCELISIGLVGTETPVRNETLEQQVNAIAYRNTGELVCSFNALQTFVQGSGYRAQDIVTVLVTFAAGPIAKVTFSCNDTLVHESEWPAPVPSLRFAVSLHGTSSVFLEKCATLGLAGSA